MEKPGHFAVKLKRSHSGRNDRQKRTLIGLGLRRIGKTILLKDTPAIRGMLYKVVHLVELERRDGSIPKMQQRG